jgi:hypothetical protein
MILARCVSLDRPRSAQQNACVIIWILVALVAVVSGAYVAFRRQRLMLPAGDGAAGLLERTVKDTRPNDVIQHDGHDYLVEGVVKYD